MAAQRERGDTPAASWEDTLVWLSEEGLVVVFEAELASVSPAREGFAVSRLVSRALSDCSLRSRLGNNEKKHNAKNRSLTVAAQSDGRGAVITAHNNAKNRSFQSRLS